MRGSLGSLIVILCNSGILVSFIFGYYFEYHIIPYLIAVPAVIFFCTFIFLPETPTQLVRMGKKEEEICRSLDFYQGSDCIHKEEIERIKKQFAEENDQKEKLTLDDFSRYTMSRSSIKSYCEFTETHTAKKALTISLFLMALDQFSGLFPMINYASMIFQQSGSSLSPNLSSIIMALLQLVGTYTSTFLVDRAGRKVSW